MVSVLKVYNYKKGGEINMNNWQRVGKTSGVTWDPETTKEISGIFKEKRTNVGPNNANIYVLENEEGTLVSVWGSSSLDLKMADVEVGNEVKIVYLGMAKNKKTNREFKNFDVFQRSTNETASDESESDEPPF